MTVQESQTIDFRSAMRRKCFLYDDGVVLSVTLRALGQLGLLTTDSGGERSLQKLLPDLTPSGFGYLRVALRSLVAQGWLREAADLDPMSVFLNWTRAGRAVADAPEAYLRVGRFLASFDDPAPASWAVPWRGELVAEYEALIGSLEIWRREFVLEAAHSPVHFEGAMIVPTVLHLQASGALADEGPVLPANRFGRAALRLLQTSGYVDADASWTGVGRELCAFATHFGMVGSYLPMFARLPELYRGELVVTTEFGVPEWHVNRELNVVASGHAHRRYYADADRIFVEIFDRTPVSSQPAFIADMGCGDGTWLARLYHLIRESTLRGRCLDTDPLLMVGIDVNEAALDCARETLREAGVPALLLAGDISDPDGVRIQLEEVGVAVEDGLHIRSFIDHNREFRGTGSTVPSGPSSGASVDSAGHALSDRAIEDDLTVHLRRWRNNIRKHGMVVLEAHSVPPQVVRRHIGSLHSIAFDAYHGYSHQLLVDHAAYTRCCREAGLESIAYLEQRYPARRPFVAISLNRLAVRPEGDPSFAAAASPERHDTWRPDDSVDLTDGEGLHRLLFDGGDIHQPRGWCAAATGVVVKDVLLEIDRRTRTATPGEVIRVMDYGAGTGLAAIELIKACRDIELEERLARVGAGFEIHLVDIPSGWFAKGYELLKGSPWTRFHSMQARDKTFRELRDVTEGRAMDIVMANMVFHLIPARAFTHVAANLAEVLAPGGRLVWSTPDLGPAAESSVLFHDPNRLARQHWMQLIAEADSFCVDGLPAAVRTAAAVAARLSEEERIQAFGRSDRRILPTANDRFAVEAALTPHFLGAMQVRSFEMSEPEFIDAVLVPSNQREYFPEVADDHLRERVLRHLLLTDVLPTLTRGPAGTGRGLNVEWTFGDFYRR
ncbi:class I SAM-dependent methyltransferase [Nocardia colli]|uniref:Class I SAM-dependent methyltransferase n=1 Tax=Nocardia colli TaxID=2545717 RepID=A0A5N0E833_9NOCA|nr:class I SAM-dependent methyltransferase [Nocardia colli]KAA8885577.1 class I SAM-dependent methyltransferase [Nocardia colli]